MPASSFRLGLQWPSLPHQPVPGGHQKSVAVGAFWRRRRKSEPQEEAAHSNAQQDSPQADNSDGIVRDRGDGGEDPVKDGVAFDAPESAEDVPLVLELAVQEGDTVDSLAKMFNMKVEKFIAANGGERELMPGSKLRFRLPLPEDPSQLRQIMGVSAAEKQNESPAAVPHLLHVIERPNPIESTIRYLSPWVVVAGTALALFVWLARKTEASEREKLRQRAAVLRLQKEAEREGAPSLEHTDVPSKTGQQSANGHSGGSTVPGSQLAPGSRPSVMYERTQSGRAASLAEQLTQPELGEGGPAADTSEGEPLHQAGRAEPRWLSLPQVHFIMLRGNQSLSFRLQPQLPNEFSWLAWEDKEEAAALLTWLMNQGSATGLVSPSILTEQIRVASMRPIEFLRLADVNEKGASFMARGSVKIMASAAEEVLWADLLSAAKSLPRQPLCDGMASVQGVLQHRLGKTQSAQPALQQTQNAPAETAWQVQLPVETAAPAVQLLSDADEAVIDVEASAPESMADLPVAPAQAADDSAAAAASHADSAVPAQPAGRSDGQGNAAHGPAVSTTSGAEAHDGGGGATAHDGGGGQQGGGGGGGDAADIEELAAALEDLRRIQDRAKSSQDYVPKMARQFAEEFGKLERDLMDAAAADPGMNAVGAAEQAEAADLEAMRSVVQNGADAGPANNTSSEQDQAQASGTNWADFSVHSSRRYPQASSQGRASSRAEDSNQATHGSTQGRAVGSSRPVAQAGIAAASTQQEAPGSLHGVLNPTHQATPAIGKEPSERSLGSSQLRTQQLAADQGERVLQADPEHGPARAGNGSHARPQAFASTSSPEAGKVAEEEGQLGAGSRHKSGRAAGAVSGAGSEVEQAEERVQRARRAEEALQASFAASEAAGASSSGPTPHAAGPSSAPGAPKKRRTDWWKQLPVIFMPCVTEAAGGDAAFVQADISPDPGLEDPHVFGFASKDDATCFSWLLQQSDRGSTCSIVPVTPAQLLAQGVGGEETGMTVFGRGQLPLPPTTPPDRLPELLAAHAQ